MVCQVLGVSMDLMLKAWNAFVPVLLNTTCMNTMTLVFAPVVSLLQYFFPGIMNVAPLWGKLYRQGSEIPRRFSSASDIPQNLRKSQYWCCWQMGKAIKDLSALTAEMGIAHGPHFNPRIIHLQGGKAKHKLQHKFFPHLNTEPSPYIMGTFH